MPAIPPRGDSTSQDLAETPANLVEDDDPIPLTRLEIHDLSSEGAKRLLHSVDASSILEDAVKTGHKILTPKKRHTEYSFNNTYLT